MNQRLLSRYHTTAAIAVIITCIISLGVQAGWLFDLTYLRTGISGSVSMNPVTALCFTFLCISLLVLKRNFTRLRKTARLFALPVLLTGTLRLAEIIFNLDLHISDLLFSEKLAGEVSDGKHNTIAPNTAFCFILSAAAILCYTSFRQKITNISDWLAFACLIIAAFSMVGYLYQAPEFYYVKSFIPMAFPTGACFFLLSLAVLMLRSEKGLFKIFLSSLEGSTMARFLMPFALLIPIATGKIRLYGEANAVYSSRFGTSLFAMMSVVLFILLIWRSAVWINRSGRRLREEIERTKVLTEELHAEQIKAYELTLLEEKVKQNKLLVEATIDAQEKEKKQIGMELHDHINQILASTRMYIEMAKVDDELRVELLDKSSEQLTYSINEIRNLSKSMVLHSVETGGIYYQLLEMTENIERSTGIKFSVDIQDSIIDELEPKQQVAIYRILEEQLNNIVKYASTAVVNIRLWKEETSVTMEIEDQGKGFDVNRKRTGIGLSNIASRTSLLNGTLNIDSAPGKGCKLSIKFPLN